MKIHIIKKNDRIQKLKYELLKKQCNCNEEINRLIKQVKIYETALMKIIHSTGEGYAHDISKEAITRWIKGGWNE